MKKKLLIIPTILSTIVLAGCGSIKEKDLAPNEKLTNAKLKTVEIVSMPTKVEYTAGQVFDDAGMVLKAIYDNGKSFIIPREQYTFSVDALTSDVTEINVRYNGVDTPIAITVA